MGSRSFYAMVYWISRYSIVVPELVPFVNEAIFFKFITAFAVTAIYSNFVI